MTALTVEPADNSKSYWGTAVTAMQEDLAVADGAITGTLKYLSSGALATDWGAGNFMALNFADIDSDASYVLVGLDPSVSSGLQKLDADHDGVFKVTNKATQKLIVQQWTADGLYKQQAFDLSGLTLATS